MIGAFITLLFCGFLTLLSCRVFSRWTSDLDPAERLGISGILGLGAVGWITFFLGMIPGGLRMGYFILGAVVVGGLTALTLRPKIDLTFGVPKGIRLAMMAAIILVAILPLTAVLAPSDMMDYDSLAYHLAVTKIWLNTGHITFLPYDHHSNFPLVVDNLYIWGQFWGGQFGAKAFSLCYLILGLIAIFGTARRWYSEQAGWWASLAFVGIPVVLWEAGTAYIDLANGLFAGYAVVFAADLMRKPRGALVTLLILCLGFAAGSKYTGLQMVIVLAVVLIIGWIIERRKAKGLEATGAPWSLGTVAVVTFASLLIASPWYVRNQINLGNPVYPFLYEQIGSRNWDQWRADLYRDEQQSFGIGRTPGGRDKLAIGSAILGLAYQPGRYTNPMQDQGGGLPMGAVGVSLIGAAALWLASGKLGTREQVILGASGLSLALWFLLSQQSRYILGLAPELSILAGGAATTLVLGRLMGAMIALQACYSFWLVKSSWTDSQIPVVLGRISHEEFVRQRVPFSEAAKTINEVARNGKVALYDEVFGYFLDVPYFWANPGHSTQIPYESISNGAEYSDGMKALGFSHVYINLALQPQDTAKRWLEAAGLYGDFIPYTESESEEMKKDLNWKWKLLLAEAVSEGRLKLVSQTKSGLLFEFAP